jgi:alpha(1,3/1,4) fucosyltransferase
VPIIPLQELSMLYANYYQKDRVNNASFDEIDKHHSYNPTYTNRLLRSEFLKHGIELNNPDVNQDRDILFSIFHDGQDITNTRGPRYLIAAENPYICPENRNKNYLQNFCKVFTWNTTLSHLPNFTHIFVPNQIRSPNVPTFLERPNFSCIINANKGLPLEIKGDLYKERIKVIKWYEKSAPNYFSLYGLGWTKPEPAFNASQKFQRRIKRIATQIFGYKPFPSYQGEIAEKRQVYEKTKFAYCYENVADLPDYITEKIFDCFFSGCVPIYWGSNTIGNHIPQSCFIDRRKFRDTEDVHNYLIKMNHDEYSNYQENIRLFLTSKDAMKFDTTSYTSTIVNTILATYRNG